MGIIPTVKANEFYVTRKNHHFSCLDWEGHMDITDDSFIEDQFVQSVFVLDLFLRLNITLRDLYTSLPAPPNSSYLCPLGHVLIKSFHTNSHTELKYCGIHPIISSFPESNIVKIALKTKPLVIIQVNITFSVIDPGIKSKEMEINTDIWTPDWAVLFDKPQIDIHMYTLTVHHFLSLIIKSLNKLNFIKVYDGPGKKAPLLSASHVTETFLEFSTSAHQATVYVSGEGEKLTHLCTFYTQEMDFFDFQTNTKSQKLKLPSSKHCINKRFCVLNIRTQKTFNINVTLEALVHEGQQNTHECSYAGLAIYDKQEGVYEHVKTECVKILYRISDERMCLSKTDESRHIVFHFSKTTTKKFRYPEFNQPLVLFSQSNTILFAFYKYKEYSSITSEIVLSAIDCKVLISHPSEAVGILLPWNDDCWILQIRHSQKHEHLYSRLAPDFFLWIQQYPLRKIMSLSGSGLLKGIQLNDEYNSVFDHT